MVYTENQRATTTARSRISAKRSSSLFKKDANTYLNRGLAYRLQADYDRTIRDLDEAIRLNPKSAVFYNERGTAFSEKGDNDRAIKDLDEAIRLDPKIADSYVNRGTFYSLKGDQDRGIKDLDEAIRLIQKMMPPTPIVAAPIIRGRPRPGDRDLDEAVRLDPKQPATFSTRGSAYLQKGLYDAAIQDFDAAIRPQS